jgi:hypothetical protein
MKRIHFICFCAIMIMASCQLKESGFTEKDGLLMVEMESIPLTEQWEIQNDIQGFSGQGYIVWTGEEHFGDSSFGRLEFKIRINNPGTYKLKWFTRVGKGEDNTEHNDTWLKIDDAAQFYAMHEDGRRVRPHGICDTDCPRGSGHEGYFKVYGAFHDSWGWHASTSDHDPHDIYAEFASPGIYTIRIAARSSWHFIDKLMLFNMNMIKMEEAGFSL